VVSCNRWSKYICLEVGRSCCIVEKSTWKYQIWIAKKSCNLKRGKSFGNVHTVSNWEKNINQSPPKVLNCAQLPTYFQCIYNSHESRRTRLNFVYGIFPSHFVGNSPLNSAANFIDYSHDWLIIWSASDLFCFVLIFFLGFSLALKSFA
jgi:hypothetical protein